MFFFFSSLSPMNMLSIVEQQEGQGEAGGGSGGRSSGSTNGRGGANRYTKNRYAKARQLRKGAWGREGEREGVMEGDKDSTRASKYIIY